MLFESSESVSELAREAWPSQAKDGDSKAPPLWKLTFDDPNSELSLPYLPNPLPENTSSFTNARIPFKHQAYPHPLQDTLFSTVGTLDLKLMKNLVSLLSKAPERKRHAHSNHQSSGYCVADGDWDEVLKQNVQEGHGSAFTLQCTGCMRSSKTRVA